MSRSHQWSDLSRMDFEILDRNRALAILPIGATEQHGPHLPVSVDTDLVSAVIERVLPLIGDALSVVALPALSYGKSNEHGAVPGTLTLAATSLIAVLRDLGASLARTGFRRLVLLNGHGGNSAVLDIVARDLKIEHGLNVVVCHWYNFNEAETLTSAEENTFGIHAGLVETSAMLAISPEKVAMSHARPFPNTAADWQSSYRHLGLTAGRGRPAWVIGDLNAEGACGDAASATAELGKRLLGNAARNFAAFLSEFAAFCDAQEAQLQSTRGPTT